jgi:hypothetical protein
MGPNTSLFACRRFAHPSTEERVDPEPYTHTNRVVDTAGANDHTILDSSFKSEEHWLQLTPSITNLLRVLSINP